MGGGRNLTRQPELHELRHLQSRTGWTWLLRGNDVSLDPVLLIVLSKTRAKMCIAKTILLNEHCVANPNRIAPFLLSGIEIGLFISLLELFPLLTLRGKEGLTSTWLSQGVVKKVKVKKKNRIVCSPTWPDVVPVLAWPPSSHCTVVPTCRKSVGSYEYFQTS